MKSLIAIVSIALFGCSANSGTEATECNEKYDTLYYEAHFDKKPRTEWDINNKAEWVAVIDTICQ
jgi:hypothetical protein